MLTGEHPMPQPTNAKRFRPNMPDYGITPEETDGMLTWEWIDTQMEKSRNYWVCTTRPDGRPHAVPVWGIWLENTLYFGSAKNSVKSRNIAHDNHVVVHLESGDDTLIIEGVLVESIESVDLKMTIDKAYAKKYPPYDPTQEEDTDTAIRYRLVPHKIMTWIENDFLNTVAYWVFDV
jgi:general stress protein 26